MDLAIRICIRNTDALTFDQLTWYQLRAWVEGAPAIIAVICFPSDCTKAWLLVYRVLSGEIDYQDPGANAHEE
jgi:hypothetical protein